MLGTLQSQCGRVCLSESTNQSARTAETPTVSFSVPEVTKDTGLRPEGVYAHIAEAKRAVNQRVTSLKAWPLSSPCLAGLGASGLLLDTRSLYRV